MGETETWKGEEDQVSTAHAPYGNPDEGRRRGGSAVMQEDAQAAVGNPDEAQRRGESAVTPDELPEAEIDRSRHDLR